MHARAHSCDASVSLMPQQLASDPCSLTARVASLPGNIESATSPPLEHHNPVSTHLVSATSPDHMPAHFPFSFLPSAPTSPDDSPQRRNPAEGDTGAPALCRTTKPCLHDNRDGDVPNAPASGQEASVSAAPLQVTSSVHLSQQQVSLCDVAAAAVDTDGGTSLEPPSAPAQPMGMNYTQHEARCHAPSSGAEQPSLVVEGVQGAFGVCCASLHGSYPCIQVIVSTGCCTMKRVDCCYMSQSVCLGLCCSAPVHTAQRCGSQYISRRPSQ
jgi:hypothetical protein